PRPRTLPSGPGRPPAHAWTSSLARSREMVSGCRTAMGVAGYIDGRPALDAAGTAAAEAARGPPTPAGPPAARALRLGGAPVGAHRGGGAGAYPDRTGRDGRRGRGRADRRGRDAGAGAARSRGAGHARRRALRGARWGDRRRRRRGDARSEG